METKDDEKPTTSILKLLEGLGNEEQEMLACTLFSNLIEHINGAGGVVCIFKAREGGIKMNTTIADRRVVNALLKLVTEAPSSSRTKHVTEFEDGKFKAENITENKVN